MPVISQKQQLKEVKLKVAEGAVAKIRTRLNAGDIEQIASARKEAGGVLFPLTLVIVEWNLTDENEKPLPITLENVRQLNAQDVTGIFAEVEGIKDFLAEAQKTASQTSS